MLNERALLGHEKSSLYFCPTVIIIWWSHVFVHTHTHIHIVNRSNKSHSKVMVYLSSMIAHAKKRQLPYHNDALLGPAAVTLPGVSWGEFTAGHKNV